MKTMLGPGTVLGVLLLSMMVPSVAPAQSTPAQNTPAKSVHAHEFCVLETVRRVNVRSKPSKYSRRVGRLSGGACRLEHLGLELASEDGDGRNFAARPGLQKYRGNWILFRRGNLQGWVHARYVREKASDVSYDLKREPKEAFEPNGLRIPLLLTLLVAGVAALIPQGAMAGTLVIQLSALLTALAIQTTAPRQPTFCAVGVDSWKTLSLRAHAGDFEQRVGAIAHNHCGIKAKGLMTKDDRWRLVEHEGSAGWVDSTHLQRDTSVFTLRWLEDITIVQLALLLLIPVACMAILLGLVAVVRQSTYETNSLLQVLSIVSGTCLFLSIIVISYLQVTVTGWETTRAYIPPVIAALVVTTIMLSLPRVRANKVASNIVCLGQVTLVAASALFGLVS
ncbi:MAG: SH3 domain-containing protein [Pseudomonadota bacterium]